MLITLFAEIESINEEIMHVLSKMKDLEITDEAYAKAADQLTKLMKNKQLIAEICLKNVDSDDKSSENGENRFLKQRELTERLKDAEADRNLKKDELELKKDELEFKRIEAEKPDFVSKDALIAAGASIAGILLIINYERMNIIASKALGFVLKR